jgi:2-polyprenyl-3-methyl-5-hydroxy-6-metoxy-1,4-benzoquinol methylase
MAATRDPTAAHEAIARRYRHLLTGRYRTMYELLPAHAAKILDFGCNEGYYLDFLQHLYRAEALGVEIDEDYVRKGRKKYPHIRFVKETSKVHGVDLAIFSDVIEHVPAGDEARLLAGIAGAMKPGGVLLLSTPNMDPLRLNLLFDPGNCLILPVVWFVKKLRIRSIKSGERYMWEKTPVSVHRHYTSRQLSKLYSPHFRLEEIRLRGSLLAPIFYLLRSLVDMPLIYLGGKSKAVALVRKAYCYIPDKIINWDVYHSRLGRFSYHATLRLVKR